MVEAPKPVQTPVAAPTQLTVNAEAEAKAFIYHHESGNRIDAVNKSSGACSLGQALPCSKLANVCPNWRTDYACVDAWFENYNKQRYGSWQNAKAWWITHKWW